MLNNKKFFDVVTPLSDFHRMSKRIAEKVQDSSGGNVADYEIDEVVPGEWVQMTQTGITKKDAQDGSGTAVPGLSMIALSPIKANTGAGIYEAHDTRVGSVTVVNIPGVRCKAGSYFFLSQVEDPANPGSPLNPTGDEIFDFKGKVLSGVAPGWKLAVRDDGKQQKAVTGTDSQNSVITEVDPDGNWIEFMIVSSYKL